MIQLGLKVVGRSLDNNSRLETLRFRSLPNAPSPRLRWRPSSLTASEGFLRRLFHSPLPIVPNWISLGARSRACSPVRSLRIWVL